MSISDLEKSWYADESAAIISAKVLSAASTNAINLKNSSGKVFGYDLTNTSATFKYVRFYNKTTTPVVGTDSPTYVVGIAPNSSKFIQFSHPLSHSLGIGISITGASPDLDLTPVIAGDVVGHISYI